ETAPLERALEAYPETLRAEERAMLAAKLGLRALDGHDDTSDDARLLDELFATLEAHETDMTIFYRRLAEVPSEPGDASDGELVAIVGEAFYGEPPEEHVRRVAEWLRRYAARVRRDGTPDTERR